MASVFLSGSFLSSCYFCSCCSSCNGWTDHVSWVCLQCRGEARRLRCTGRSAQLATRSPAWPGCLRRKVDLVFRGGSCLTEQGCSGCNAGSICSAAAAACRPASVSQPTRSRSMWLHTLSEPAACAVNSQSSAVWLLETSIFSLACRSEPYVNSLVKMYVRRPYCCHELFGFDIMLDENLKPWILEVNISPR